jgi:hypothetical protein
LLLKALRYKRRMNPIHAAALALVGWYLMMPFSMPDHEPNTSAPLSRWAHYSSFDSAKECEQAAAQMRAKFQVGALKDADVANAY